ncbi:MAG: transporter substrate-binding domain-containing protein [Acidobacteriota bacterium]|nr:transporter substrate-binding domain-containing protein [Acidobacteriota bacterium]
MNLPPLPFRPFSGPGHAVRAGARAIVLAAVLAALFLLPLLPASSASAQGGPPEQPAASAPEDSAAPQVLTVGTKEAAPFAFKDESGEWQGLSIELWRSVADELGVEYEFREMPLQEMVEELENGSLAVAVAALTITEDREAAFDFSHPFYTSGLGIAIADGGSRWLSFLRGVFSIRFIQVVAVLSLILLLAGTLLWLFERRNNAEQFGERWFQGLGHAFWWSAVTMTTVGYGDKAPVTLGGRFVALIWMFASVILISSFTAGIASSLTAHEFKRNSVQGPRDLPKVQVATVAGTTSQNYLQAEAVTHQSRPSVEAALEDLVAGEVEAVVYDAPILLHLAQQQEDHDFIILPSTFTRQDYGIAFPSGSPLRERVNVALLHHIRSPAWQETVFEYLGQQP